MTLNRNIFVWLGIVLATGSIAEASWKEKLLYSFQGGTDGAYPAGGVVFDKQGNLNGATQQGGGTNCSPVAACGTIYQLVPPAKKGDPWTENVLHVFQGKEHNDGEFPSGGVIADASGNIYGTSSYGGTGGCVLLGIKGGCGTVFELSPPQTKGGKWNYTILYSFKGGKDGYLPLGDLVFDSAGNLYGATDFGGGKGTTCDPYYQYCGTVFRLSPPKTKGGKWTEEVLHSFAGMSNSHQNGDGANPNGALVLDNEGNIYGTTSIGGHDCPGFVGVGCGTVFELNAPTKNGGKWAEKILHRFTRGKDGGGLDHGVIFDAKGALYGTTSLGGTQDSGVVFRFTHRSGRWNETILHNLQGTKDQSNVSDLVFDSIGNLYCASGAILRLKPPQEKGGKWTVEALYEFRGPPDGRSPSDLTFGKASTLYGTTTWGGAGQNCQGGCGTVFQASP
jgi:uncharacterized repeat protein (TIGR03803 family)